MLSALRKLKHHFFLFLAEEERAAIFFSPYFLRPMEAATAAGFSMSEFLAIDLVRLANLLPDPSLGDFDIWGSPDKVLQVGDGVYLLAARK